LAEIGVMICAMVLRVLSGGPVAFSATRNEPDALSLTLATHVQLWRKSLGGRETGIAGDAA
jgi:hypothetical protein